MHAGEQRYGATFLGVVMLTLYLSVNSVRADSLSKLDQEFRNVYGLAASQSLENLRSSASILLTIKSASESDNWPLTRRRA
jgi:hypothetical protein